MCDHCASTDGARRAQNCALYTSVCFVVSVPLFAMCSRLFMSVCRSQMFVNMRCRIYSLYTSPVGDSRLPSAVTDFHDKNSKFFLHVETLPANRYSTTKNTGSPVLSAVVPFLRRVLKIRLPPACMPVPRRRG